MNNSNTRHFPVSPAVAIVAAADMVDINLAMMRQLSQKYGFRTFLYVFGKEGLRSHQKYVDDGSLDGVVIMNAFETGIQAENLDSEAVVSRAVDYERRIGCSFGLLNMARRETGIGFALGGVNHLLSTAARDATNVQTLHAQCEAIAFWEREIREKKLTLILNGSRIEAVVTRMLGIEYRFLYATRYKNFYFWSHNEYMEFPNLQEAFVAASADDQIELKEQYLRDVFSRSRFVGKRPYQHMLVNIWKSTLRRIYLRYKGYKASNEYFFSDILKYRWRYARASIWFQKKNLTTLKDLKECKFVYFPLQTEPEASLQLMSPEHFFQLEAITSIARDLPADTLLVVKEAIYALGRRPRDFYKTLSLLKNVVMMDIYEPGFKVAKQATAVATISGTGGIEAAISGVPVILFGRHGGYQFLDHVFPVWRNEDLRPALCNALSNDFNRAKARRDGSQLANALEAISFDMDRFNTVQKNSHSPEAVAEACRVLVNSLSTVPS